MNQTLDQSDTKSGVQTAAAKVARSLELLLSLPTDLPEPVVSTYTSPEIRWANVDEPTARRIIAFLGYNDWSVYTYDQPHTIASRYLDATFDDNDIVVVVVVDGANIPDLATEVVR